MYCWIAFQLHLALLSELLRMKLQQPLEIIKTLLAKSLSRMTDYEYTFIHTVLSQTGKREMWYWMCVALQGRFPLLSCFFIFTCCYSNSQLIVFSCHKNMHYTVYFSLTIWLEDMSGTSSKPWEEFEVNMLVKCKCIYLGCICCFYVNLFTMHLTTEQVCTLICYGAAVPSKHNDVWRDVILYGFLSVLILILSICTSALLWILCKDLIVFLYNSLEYWTKDTLNMLKRW